MTNDFKIPYLKSTEEALKCGPLHEPAMDLSCHFLKSTVAVCFLVRCGHGFQRKDFVIIKDLNIYYIIRLGSN